MKSHTILFCPAQDRAEQSSVSFCPASPCCRCYPPSGTEWPSWLPDLPLWYHSACVQVTLTVCRSRSHASTYTSLLALTVVWMPKPCSQAPHRQRLCTDVLTNSQFWSQPTTSTKSQHASENTPRRFQLPHPLSFPSRCPR